ncbi:Wzy polymerase domain-containing protein [Vibrio sp. SS-MA-C1-2]|uniref:PglL family O-oligosaccharyltransferase n=1 Tax=Vibrio sp. SS-MA-C1-2 TaxID=2908646 RepID=UPI001F18AFC6|nr:Wzy polymerase domain-containing protein [Vibrio sp. SS-MA-C1-2]UJF19516.1 Wzy polymerase domain-containing protein [Vibrio sp. SS-MA-C1-2]
MSILHLRGTTLAARGVRKPLIKPLIITLGLFFVAAMHFYMRNLGGTGLSLPFNSFGWIFIAAAISIGFIEAGRQHKLRYNSLTLKLIFCAILLTIPLSYSNANISESYPRIVGLWAGVLFFFSLQQFSFNYRQKQAILWLIIVAVWIEAVLGWAQFLLFDSRNSGGYELLANRPYGIFQHSNLMASFLATGLVISGYMLARVPMYRGKINFRHTLLLITPILTIPLLIVLFSRVGWIGAFVGSLLLIPYLIKFAPKKLIYLWVATLVIAATMTIIGEGYINSEIPSQHLGFESARWYTFPQTLHLFAEYPWMGVGYGNFESAYIINTAQWQQANYLPYYGLPGFTHPHNELLYWISEGGLIPLMALLYASWLVLSRILKAVKGTRLALVALFFPIVIHTQLEFPFYQSLPHWVIFIVLIYWIDSLNPKRKQFELKHYQIMKVLGVILFSITFLLMATTLYQGSYVVRYQQGDISLNKLERRLHTIIIWQNSLDQIQYESKLERGIASQNRQLLDEYIVWATEQAKRHPRPKIYQQLFRAHQALGQQQQAELIKLEGNYLFNHFTITDPDYHPSNATKTTPKNVLKTLTGTSQ